MSNLELLGIFANYQKYYEHEQETRENIRLVVREIEQAVKEAAIQLQIIHGDLKKIDAACTAARVLIASCSVSFKKLAELVPQNQYYRYSDHWTFNTQRLVFLCALVVYLETGILITREAVAEMLDLKLTQAQGFHLDIEDYLMGVLQMASELSRFATNSVTMGDFDRPMQIARFINELNSGYRLLNLKNDSLRKRFDALKYDVKKIEEIVYDISIRGLTTPAKESPDEDKDSTSVTAGQ